MTVRLTHTGSNPIVASILKCSLNFGSQNHLQAPTGNPEPFKPYTLLTNPKTPTPQTPQPRGITELHTPRGWIKEGARIWQGVLLGLGLG